MFVIVYRMVAGTWITSCFTAMSVTYTRNTECAYSQPEINQNSPANNVGLLARNICESTRSLYHILEQHFPKEPHILHKYDQS